MPAHPDYQALFAALPGIHLALTPELTIVAASARAAEVAGQPLDQLLGQAAAAVFAPGAAAEQGLVGAELQTGVAAVARSGAAHEARAGGWQHRTWPVWGPENELRYLLYRAEPTVEIKLEPAEVSAADTDYRQLFDTLPVIVWTTRADGGADYHSVRWLEYTGLSLAQANADGWLAVVHPDDRARVLETWRQARAAATDYAVEYRMRRADGQYRWHLVRGIPRRDAAGAVTGWTGTTLDIHDQKLTEQRLAAQDRHFQQILSQVPAHIATLLGPDHVYGFLNERGNQLFGGKVRAGMPAALAVPELVTNGYIKLVDEIYRTGEPFVLTEMPMEQPPAADGSVATLYFDGVLQPLTDEQGQTQGILVFGIDVTERVEAKQRTAELMAEIREQDAQFRTMVESLPLFIYIADDQGQILYINPQRYEFTGQQPEPGFRHWTEPLHPEDRRRLQADFARGRALGQPWSGEYRLRRHDGLYRWHLLRAVPLRRPEDGSIARWYASSVDIDDQKQFQRQLETKDEYLRQILTQAPAMIATLEGPEHRYAFFNARYEQLVGGRAALGRPVATVLPELAEQGFLPILDQVYRTQQPYVGQEMPVWLTDPATGELRLHYLNFTYQALRDNQGQPQGILAFLVEVTEQVLARQRAEGLATQLQRSDERLRRMTEALPVMTFINDAAGRTEYTSPQWRQYAGYPESTDVNEVWDALLHPDDRARARAEYAAALAEKRGWNLEVRLRRHDGLYRWHLSHTVPALTDEGLKWYGSTVDIHEQKRLSQELAASTAHFSQLLEALPQLTWTARPDDGQVSYTNRSFQAYTGATAQELLGTGWARFVHPDDQTTTFQGLPAVIRTGTGAQTEHRLRGADGRYRWFLGNLLPLRNSAGEITQWLGTNTDIDDQKRVQEQLRRQDQRLSQILGQAPAIIATMDGPEHRYAFFNEAHNALMNNRAVLGQPLAELLPELVEQGFVARLDQVFQTGETFVGHEVPIQPVGRPAGAPSLYLDLTFQALRDEQGQIFGVLAFAVDTTERVRARQSAGALAAEIGRRDLRLRRMTEALPAVSFICAPDGTMQYLSPQWYHYTGQTTELQTGDIFTALVHPDEQPEVRRRLRQALMRGEPWELHYRLRHHDGHYRWQISRGVPEYDAQGQALRWYGTLVDNHEQRELQNQLQRSEEQFRFMAESIPQIVWTARPDGQLDYINQRWTELTGRSVAYALEFGWTELLPPAERENITANFMAGMHSGTDYEQESQLLSAHDERYRWFLHRATPMRDAAGQVVKWFGTSTDIDDFKQARQQLEARNQQLARTNADLDSFVYTASHDLKQPINNMAGIFEELTRTAYFRDPEAIKLITMFERALQQIHQTIHDLSDVVQLQRRHALVPAENVDLAALTREVLASMQEQSAALQAEFNLDFAALSTVRFVRPNLQSILYNLLSNALKYAEPGRPPRVEVSGSLQDGTPVLTVRDNGQGIDLERHGSQLFQLFRRFHEHVEGSGMGLYLVNRMVQLNGAWLEVDSEVGVGSTFRIYFKAQDF
ncbi:PAS domain S-box protein [Hymenobacter chitinivorans]|uniref:histidine kinase n=1 Tax=Hymenobacter chitinivorans DSM 11115 TaxID=1121954 RepID=A0A2M9BRL2_9BACT|nr:PAS domain S-box protein [Hymenobacter chitinivorans]PJJ60599.1 PAS domain S-box-containing protein [Hymenobacter chitinivorans DSM 11115]